MDIDRLISMVFERPSLWDKCHKLHSDRNVTSKLWKEISSEMNEDETRLRKKWRYLRDQFSLERKLQATRSTVPKWPFYNSLLFLKDFVQPRTHGPMTLVRAIGYPPLHAEDNDEASDSQETHDNPTLNNEPSSPILRNYDDELTSFQSSRRQNNDDDEHTFFFKSLLPHVSKIPQHKILSFRNRIQDVVEEFAYQPQMSYEPRCISKPKSSKLTGTKRRAYEDASPEYVPSADITIKEENSVEDENKND